MIDQETAEKMYIEQNEALTTNLKEQTKAMQRDKFRLVLNVIEVVGILAIAIFLWR